MTYRMVELEADRRLRLLGTGDDIEADDDIGIRPLGLHHCEITYTAVLTFAQWPAPAGRIVRPLLIKIGRDAVRGLQRALNPPVHKPQKSGKPTLAQRLVLPTAAQFTEYGYLGIPNKAHSRFMDGKTVVITGPTSGIGLAAACELARLGARLVLVGRGQQRLEQAAEKILEFSGGPTGIRLVEADLCHAKELDRAAQSILNSEARVDVLINNAGALFAQRELTAEGHERSFSVNLLAPMRLTQKLLPALQQPRGRVINVSSGGQYLQPLRADDLQYERGIFNGSKAYARAKRGLVALTRSLAKQYPNVGFHSMHPGWVATPGVSKSLPAFDRIMGPILRDPRMGADTIVWLCTEDPAVLGSGNFWFDRKAQPYDVLPGTTVKAAQLKKLMKHIAPSLASPGGQEPDMVRT